MQRGAAFGNPGWIDRKACAGRKPYRRSGSIPAEVVEVNDEKASSIDEYLAGVPEDQRAALEKLRANIKAAAPRATETISYGTSITALVKKLVKARLEEIRGGKRSRKPTARRERYPMPDYVERELEGRGLVDAYRRRPPYQQNDYIGWITRARQESTRQQRLEQMLGELEAGDAYMKMPYQPKLSKPN